MRNAVASLSRKQLQVVYTSQPLRGTWYVVRVGVGVGNNSFEDVDPRGTYLLVSLITVPL